MQSASVTEQQDQFSAAQCRAARGLLDWTQAQLAEAALVNRMTVKRFEKGGALRPAQAAAMRRALEDAGVLFLSRAEADSSFTAGVGLRAGAGPPDAADGL